MSLPGKIFGPAVLCPVGHGVVTLSLSRRLEQACAVLHGSYTVDLGLSTSASPEAEGARGRRDLSHTPGAQLEMPASLGTFSKPLSRWRDVTKTLLIWAAYLGDILK